MADFAASGGGGGGGGDHGIAAAKELLADVIGNRKALSDVYGAYESYLDPISQEAIDAAKAIMATTAPAIQGIGAEGSAGIGGAYGDASQAVEAAAQLIGAPTDADDIVTAAVTSERDAILADSIADTASAVDVAGLKAKAAEADAVAAESLDLGDIRRRANAMDSGFEDMEEQARERLAAARAAAAAAAARRRAAIAQRNKEIADLQDEKMEAMRLDPHEAGEVTALNFLRTNGRDLDYNRQQLVMSTVSNAISQQVGAGQVARYAREQGIPLRPAEVKLTSGALRAYTSGMRYQQTRDQTPYYGGGGGGLGGQGY